MSNQEPSPLLPIVSMMARTVVTPSDFAEYVRSADENDATLTQLRVSLARWDAAPAVASHKAGQPETEPRTQSRRLAIYEGLELDAACASAVSARSPVYEAPVTIISKAFEPWYSEARQNRASVYWDDYERYLRETKGWSAKAIASLDETTNDVVERLSDPTRETVKQTKGLVVGYVQSGKTANFTGAIAKSIDAGYRLIIVLTGTIEILRAQTQRRMDMELLGVENILSGLDPNDPQVARELDYQQDIEWLNRNFVTHGDALSQPNVVSIQRITTHKSDYKRLPQGLSRLKFQKFDKMRRLNDPENLFRLDAHVAVIKKNAAPLRKLIADLAPIKGDLAQLPVLIIDDESDQASVDTTNPARWNGPTNATVDRQRTTINRLITDLLKLCPRAQYVGYTATPFANVFVDPDDESDVFPSDFVLSLHRPPGYMGVREFHDVGKRWEDEDKTIANSNELAHVRELVGAPADDDIRRNQELQEAIDAWVLSGAIKKFRESHSTLRFRHHTMLVHESVKRSDHAATAEVVKHLWRAAGFTSSVGLSRLRRLFDDDFGPVMGARANGSPIPVTFDEVKPFIGEALASMTVDHDPVLVVNSDKNITDNQRKLDFESDQVWRILVGGTQLSRGFTVEGLTVSYFRRKAGQADTLMQAGRWFGFRNGYQDLVRLYIRRDEKVDLYEAFEALLLDEEAFRDEIRQYEGFDDNGLPLVEPRQIPPLVSQHLPWLRPTARTKMWNAVIESKATARGFQDLYGVPQRRDPRHFGNLNQVAVPLLSIASEEFKFRYAIEDNVAKADSGSFRARVGYVDGRNFLSLFDQLEWSDGFSIRVDPIMSFLRSATEDGRIEDWTVFWPWPNKEGTQILIDGLSGPDGQHVPVSPRGRREGTMGFFGSSPHHRAASLPIARGEELAVQMPNGDPILLPAKNARGVALIYLVDDRTKKERSETPPKVGDIVPLLSLAVPSSATPHRRDLIQWTVRVKSEPDNPAVPIVKV
ncbi:Z1 domain-containing protein [Hoyosella sp. G463]|uniref:Z1 domain-containing protein n=2 Tax=Lolliginicoccus lacisalsi TaxID=2742202 RepID=A0A927JEW0_9ACTN|nr:Z1 domain-containing protein [Lolliginicoccus lacisalsi]